MGRVPWKQGKVISVETRKGVYVLAQMLVDPYLMFFNAFRESNEWDDVEPGDLPTLYCAPTTTRFISQSNPTYHKKLKPAEFETLPDHWIRPFGYNVIRTIWAGTPLEMTVGYMGEKGGQLLKKPIQESGFHPTEIVINQIPFDDDETIDHHETSILLTHPHENERLYLCYLFGKNVDPYKDLMFQRELPTEYEQYMRLIAEDEDDEDED